MSLTIRMEVIDLLLVMTEQEQQEMKARALELVGSRSVRESVTRRIGD